MDIVMLLNLNLVQMDTALTESGWHGEVLSHSYLLSSLNLKPQTTRETDKSKTKNKTHRKKPIRPHTCGLFWNLSEFLK